MSLETWSDGLGFVSGVVLMVTAFRNDGLHAFIVRLRQRIADAKRDHPMPDKWAGPVVEGLEKDLASWSPVDRWLLRAGAALLCLSYGVKAVPALWGALVGP